MVDYKNIRELSEKELWNLKDLLYWNPEEEFLTDRQRDIIKRAEVQEDIPDELIYDVFDCYDFVDDDFWCNV